MRSAVDLEHSAEFNMESNQRKVESEKGRKVLGMVFSRTFQCVFNHGNAFQTAFRIGIYYAYFASFLIKYT